MHNLFRAHSTTLFLFQFLQMPWARRASCLTSLRAIVLALLIKWMIWNILYRAMLIFERLQVSYYLYDPLCLEPWAATINDLSKCGGVTSSCPGFKPMNTSSVCHVSRYYIYELGTEPQGWPSTIPASICPYLTPRSEKQRTMNHPDVVRTCACEVVYYS